MDTSPIQNFHPNTPRKVTVYKKVLWNFQIWAAKDTRNLCGRQNIPMIEKSSCTNFFLNCQLEKHLNFQRGPFNPNIGFKISIITRGGTINENATWLNWDASIIITWPHEFVIFSLPNYYWLQHWEQLMILLLFLR